MDKSAERRPLSRLDHKIMNRLISLAAKLFFRFYGRWRVYGLENIPKTGGLLFVANHASYIDPPLGWAAADPVRRVWGIAKSELWDKRYVGYILDCIGVFPVHRQSADRAMFRRALELLAQGEAVGLFPEGTRTANGELQPPRSGIALLVQKSGVPVVPVGLLGTFEMLPRNRKSLKRVPLTVVFGKPLEFSREATREEITSSLMRAIAQLMTEHGRPTAPPVAGSTESEQADAKS